MPVPFMVCAAFTAISAAVSLLYSVMAIRREAGGARTMAIYATSRSVALLIVSAVPVLTGSVQWLVAVATAMTIVQAGDAGIGVAIGDRVKIYGPAATAVLNLAAIVWLIWGKTVRTT